MINDSWLQQPEAIAAPRVGYLLLQLMFVKMVHFQVPSDTSDTS